MLNVAVVFGPTGILASWSCAITCSRALSISASWSSSSSPASGSGPPAYQCAIASAKNRWPRAPIWSASSPSSSTIVGHSAEKWSFASDDTKRSPGARRDGLVVDVAQRRDLVGAGEAEHSAPMPYSAASLTVSFFVHAMYSGGCGICTGRGRIGCGVDLQQLAVPLELAVLAPPHAADHAQRLFDLGVGAARGRRPRPTSPGAWRPVRRRGRGGRPESTSSIAARSATRTGWL